MESTGGGTFPIGGAVSDLEHWLCDRDGINSKCLDIQRMALGGCHSSCSKRCTCKCAVQVTMLWRSRPEQTPAADVHADIKMLTWPAAIWFLKQGG